MRIFQGFDSLPQFVHPAVTVGSYDGVHLGHKALIDTLVAEAHANGGESIVLTFEPHPRITLGRAEGLRLLTTFEEKAALLADLGVDNVVVIPFDKTFGALSGEEFIRQYLIGRLGAETLVAGYDHRFGHDRTDCALAVELGLKVVRIDECSVAGEHVSSTAIRRLIDAGQIAEAERLLGHPLMKNALKITVHPERTQASIDTLIALWRASVEASHCFLTPDRIEDLVPTVRDALVGIETLLVGLENDRPVGFMGIEAGKAEMLFVAPERFGQGVGKKLMLFGIGEYGVKTVDVNEQNPKATAFYRRLGFEVVGHTDCDEQGNPYPILKMKLSKIQDL